MDFAELLFDVSILPIVMTKLANENVSICCDFVSSDPATNCSKYLLLPFWSQNANVKKGYSTCSGQDEKKCPFEDQALVSSQEALTYIAEFSPLCSSPSMIFFLHYWLFLPLIYCKISTIVQITTTAVLTDIALTLEVHSIVLATLGLVETVIIVLVCSSFTWLFIYFNPLPRFE